MSAHQEAFQKVLDDIEQLWAKVPDETARFVATAPEVNSGSFTKLEAVRKTLADQINFINVLRTDRAAEAVNAVHSTLQSKLLTALHEFRGLLEQFLANLKQENLPTDSVRDMQNGIRRWTDDHAERIENFSTRIETGSVSQAQAVRELKDVIARASETAETLKQQTREGAGVTLAGTEKSVWDAAVRYHNLAANLWLGLLLVSVAITLRLLMWMAAEDDQWVGVTFRQLAAGADTAQIVSYAATKILIASFSVGLAIFAARSYTSHMHNVVINRQRALSMDGFTKLIASLPEDKEVRTEVVKTATLTLFAHTNTGFLDRSKSELQPLLALVETVKDTFAPKKE